MKVTDEKVGVFHVLMEVFSTINGSFQTLVLIPSGYLE